MDAHTYLSQIDMEYRVLCRKISEMEKKKLKPDEETYLDMLKEQRQEMQDNIEIGD